MADEEWKDGEPNAFAPGVYDVQIERGGKFYRAVVLVKGLSHRVVDGFDFYGQIWWYCGEGRARHREHRGEGKVPAGSDKGSAFVFEKPPKDGRWYVTHKGVPDCPRVVKWRDGDGYEPGYYDANDVDHQMGIVAHLPQPVPE